MPHPAHGLTPRRAGLQVQDIRAMAAKAAKGEVMSVEELALAARSLGALLQIQDLLSGAADDFPTLFDFAQDIDIEPKVFLYQFFAQ